jgi:hypothetical protein
LTLLLPQPAQAAPDASGTIGAQTRATIRISISVAPRVALISAPMSNAPQLVTARQGLPMVLTASAPGLRYAIIAASAALPEARQEPLGKAQLSIIVPD